MAAATIRPASTTNTISTPAPVLKSAVNPPPPEPTATTAKTLRRISHHPTLTPYRRRVYRTLLSIPAGRWTTYAALSKHLDSSARAVGGAMRGNPFAPAVPCHRVLGSGGVIGGYKGAWERDGSCSASASASASAAGDGNGNGETTGVEKRRMLEMEGVAFDAAGRAKGECFGEFWDLGDVSGMDGKKKGMGDGNDGLQ